MAEAQDTLYRTFRHPVDDKLEVLRLQVGDTHMLHHSLIAQLTKSRQGLIDYLEHVGELHIMHINQVYIVDVQTLQALIYTLLGTLC